MKMQSCAIMRNRAVILLVFYYSSFSSVVYARIIKFEFLRDEAGTFVVSFFRGLINNFYELRLKYEYNHNGTITKQI